jgi:hypothetical protein
MASKSELAILVSFHAISLEYELFVGVAAVGELVAIIAIVVIGASAFVASHIVASCIVAASVGIVDQPQQEVGGGSAVEQLVEVVAGGALDIVAVVDHLAVAVEAFVALVVAALVVAALVSALVVPSLVVAASKIVETPH